MFRAERAVRCPRCAASQRTLRRKDDAALFGLQTTQLAARPVSMEPNSGDLTCGITSGIRSAGDNEPPEFLCSGTAPPVGNVLLGREPVSWCGNLGVEGPGTGAPGAWALGMRPVAETSCRPGKDSSPSGWAMGCTPWVPVKLYFCFTAKHRKKTFFNESAEIFVVFRGPYHALRFDRAWREKSFKSAT